MAILLVVYVLGRIELDSLQKALAALGSPWQAGRTSVSELSDEEWQNLYGTMSQYCFELDKFQVENMSPSEPQGNGPKLPSALDWRNRNGYNWMTPVKNQEGCGNCYVFATVGGFEARLKIVSNMPDSNVDLSEEFATCCDKRNYGCNGGQLCVSARFMIEKGLPDEGCFPYPSPGKVLPCINACPDWEGRAVRAKKWGATSNVQEYKARIMEGPLACWLNPKEDFFYYKGGVYTPIMGDKYIHAVTLCGWNDSLGAWLFKNSWGTSWGDSGYGWVNYGEEHIVGPGYPVWLEVEPLKSDEEKEEMGISIRVFPNPARFNINVWFSFRVTLQCPELTPDTTVKISVNVYDIAGKFVCSLVNDIFQSKNCKICWDCRDEGGKRVSPGIYFIKLIAGEKAYVKKAILLE